MKKWIPAAVTAAGAYLIAIAPRLCERPERMPKVYYAHRGLHDNISDAPENSLAAFQKAVDAGYGNVAGLSGTDAWLVMLFYTLQLYFDFSGSA